ncbi:phosphoribosylglycinamide synthetase [Streptomyces triticagri]|uniref:Phosphoribosylglycinamide synthetase n=1 Tax=Streptomyces triticagri TaxID=2293568 RepID=A0A372M421_9ACTN|nr:phosphoribosylglycinamide synthetase [Streptomyces triticagri]RFU85213.1 phosphoribosylglycinamide synthetase [Streptomyces triticagri]
MSPLSSKSSRTRLLLAMPYHQLARKATETGFRVWSMWDPKLAEADLLPRIEAASEQLLLTSFTDESSLRRLIRSTASAWGVGTVLCFGDGPGSLSVVEEAWRLGLSPNPPEAYTRLRAHGRTPAPAPRLSVQTLTVAGRHHVVGVTAQRTSGPPHFVVTGYLHPAPLTDAERSATERLVVAWLDRSGYRFGPAQTEVALTSGGPEIISCRPHPGADRIPLLIEVARGFDVETAIFEALLDKEPVVPAPFQYAEIGFFLLPEGRLETYTGTENIAVTPWVRGARFPYGSGDLVPPLTDPRARRGYVVVEGDSPQLTGDRVRQAREDLMADIQPA